MCRHSSAQGCILYESQALLDIFIISSPLHTRAQNTHPCSIYGHMQRNTSAKPTIIISLCSRRGQKKQPKTSIAEATRRKKKKIRVGSSVSSDTKRAPQRQEPQIGAQGWGNVSTRSRNVGKGEESESKGVDLLGIIRKKECGGGG